ncbi:MAG: type II toxin-antitoxin system RelE/ParE family toxin [Thermoanaerobaculia bacterium]|nr:type II toxin-antitoxin system RelE/ParE family toxin [Thermoanaerobaculia bacterium]
MKIVWSDPAVEDLESIHAYILRDSERYARQFVGRIIEAAESLEALPRRGRQVPEARERTDVRELLFQSYRIIYRLETSRVLIVAVIHGSRNLAGIDPVPWESPEG